MKNLISGVFLTLVLSGCASTGAYTKTGPALVSNFRESGMATAEVAATKTGQACSENILGVVGTGDSSIDAAKKAGGITRVSSIDYDFKNVLFLYGKVCTIVKGE